MNDEERRQAAEAWNNWKPGKTGRRSSSPFNKPIPPVETRDGEGRPLNPDGALDVEKFIQEKENEQ